MGEVVALSVLAGWMVVASIYGLLNGPNLIVVGLFALIFILAVQRIRQKWPEVKAARQSEQPPG